MAFDLDTVRKEFPILSRQIDGAPLVYLDSGNTSQKPRRVIDAMTEFLEHSYAPINRSSYRLAGEATEAYEGARKAVARLINAPSADEVIFTKNATESMNLIARSWGVANLGEGDVVVLTHMEHHANIVPWQMLRDELGIEIRWVPLTADGQLDLADLDRLLDGAKVFSFTAMSNVLGTIPPVTALCTAAHDAGALAVVDACQYVPHNATDVQAWDADLVAFSSHKMCGPSGIGMLWGRMELLDAMPPVPRRRQHDRHRHPRRLHHRARSRRSSRPALPRSPRRSACARRSSSSRTSAWRTSAATRWTSRATRSTP